MPSYQQILAGTSLTVTETFQVDGTPIDVDSGLPVLTLTKPDGTVHTPTPTVLNSWAGPPARSTGQYRFVLPAQATPYYLDYALVGTIGGQAQTFRGRVEWVGANLFNISDLRGMRVAGSTPFASNSNPLISTEQIQETRAACLDELQHFLGFSPVPRFAREVASGNGGGQLRLVHPGLEATSVVSVTVAGVVQSISGYTIDPGGWLETTSNYVASGYFPAGRRNVAVEYLHGWDRPRGHAGRAAMVWAAALLNPSGFSSATTVSLPTGESYSYEPAEVGRGGYERFTGVRELDRWLNSHRSKAAVA